MRELELSPKARRRLWQGISLLLRLADEAEKNDFTNSQLCEAIGSVPGVEATGLTADIADTNASEVTEDNKLSKRD